MAHAKRYEPWYDPETEKSRLLKALDEVRRLCCSAQETIPHTTMPGSFMALQAIKDAVDSYAECQMGHREYFWGRPHSACGMLAGIGWAEARSTGRRTGAIGSLGV